MLCRIAAPAPNPPRSYARGILPDHKINNNAGEMTGSLLGHDTLSSSQAKSMKFFATFAL